MTGITALGGLVGGKGEGLFHFYLKSKRREVEVTGCYCLSVNAGVPRGMFSLGTATVPHGHSPKQCPHCQSGTQNKPLGAG